MIEGGFFLLLTIILDLNISDLKLRKKYKNRIVTIFCIKPVKEDLYTFYCSVTKEMTECVNKNVYNEKGAECSEVQIERLLQHFGPTLQRDLSLRYNPAQCK